MKKLLRTFFLPVLLIGNLSAQDLDSLKQKAELGEITAVKNLINLYKLGSETVERNNEQVILWTKKAAELNDPKGLYELGLFYLTGLIVEMDIEKGIDLISQSADHQFPAALLYLGKLYLFGYYNQPKDTTAALKYLKNAARLSDNPEANTLLGIFELNNKKPDFAQAYKYFHSAALANNGKAQYYIGLMYKNGFHVKQDFKEAAHWFKLSARQRDAQALYSLGYLFYKGLGVDQDYKMAVNFFRLSAEQENPNGLMMLGLCYKEGFGLPKSQAAADYFLNRSKEIFDNYQINQAITEGLQMQDRARINEVNEDLAKYYPQNTYHKIDKAPEQVEVNGNWTGKAFVYDWGGNKIREELDLSLSLTQTGSSVTGVVTIMY